MRGKEGQAGHEAGQGASKAGVRNVSLGSMEVANQTGQSGLFVQAFVNNRNAKLLMDTGASLSIVAPHVVPDIKVDEHVPDIFVADGSPLKIKGTATLSITIDGDTMQQKVVVAEIGVDGILGLDFMRMHACSIDIANNTAILSGKTIQLNLEGTIGCYRVYLDKSLDLPPRSEVLTVGRIQGNVNAPMVNLGVGIIEPVDQFTKSNRGLVARTLTDGQEKVPVRILNLENHGQRLQKGTLLAQYCPVSNIYEDTVCLVSSTDQIPEHLKDLYSRSTARLEPEQCVTLKKFLIKYQGLFAKNEGDLGRADSVEHRINTGDATPIKQAARRLPEHMHAEVDKHLD